MYEKDEATVFKQTGLALTSNEETQVERLERTKKHLQSRIQDIDRALELLQKHPEINELQDLLRRI